VISTPFYVTKFRRIPISQNDQQVCLCTFLDTNNIYSRCYKRCYSGGRNYKRFCCQNVCHTRDIVSHCWLRRFIKSMMVALEKPSPHNMNLWSMVAIALDGTFLDHIISKVNIRLKTFVLLSITQNRPKNIFLPPHFFLNGFL